MKYSGRKGNWVPIDHYDDDVWCPKRVLWQSDMRLTVIRTAVNLLAEVGPRAFTVKEVALRSGIARTSIYKYFGIKADLLLTCREKAMSQARQRITACLLGRSGPPSHPGVQAASGAWLERIEATLQQAAARAGVESDLWLLTAAEGIRSYRPPLDSAGGSLSPVPSWLVAEVNVLVDTAQHAGELPETLNATAAAELICACWWYYLCAFKPWSSAGMTGREERWGTAIRHVAHGLAGA